MYSWGVRLQLFLSAAIPSGRDVVPLPGKRGIALSEVRVRVSVPACVPRPCGLAPSPAVSGRDSHREQQGGSRAQLPGLCKQGAALSSPSPSQGSCSCCVPTEQGNVGSFPHPAAVINHLAHFKPSPLHTLPRTRRSGTDPSLITHRSTGIAEGACATGTGVHRRSAGNCFLSTS